jgi:hypothetical protein
LEKYVGGFWNNPITHPEYSDTYTLPQGIDKSMERNYLRYRLVLNDIYWIMRASDNFATERTLSYIYSYTKSQPLVLFNDWTHNAASVGQEHGIWTWDAATDIPGFFDTRYSKMSTMISSPSYMQYEAAKDFDGKAYYDYNLLTPAELTRPYKWIILASPENVKAVGVKILSIPHEEGNDIIKIMSENAVGLSKEGLYSKGDIFQMYVDTGAIICQGGNIYLMSIAAHGSEEGEGLAARDRVISEIKSILDERGCFDAE